MGIQKGRGLSLATTYSIVTRHDGFIIVESEVGVGTSFIFFFPASEKDISDLEPLYTPEIEEPSVRTGKVLLMDDEEMIRDLAGRLLNRIGYDPVLAKNGGESIEEYKRAMNSGKPFDAVILDLTVKEGMGGNEALKQILSSSDSYCFKRVFK